MPSFRNGMNTEWSRFKIRWNSAINLELEQYYSIFHTFFLNLAAQLENLRWFSINLGGFMFFYIETIWSIVFTRFWPQTRQKLGHFSWISFWGFEFLPTLSSHSSCKRFICAFFVNLLTSLISHSQNLEVLQRDKGKECKRDEWPEPLGPWHA